MGRNILITGAAGYIGGSVLADFVSRYDDPRLGNLNAAVRSQQQVQALSKLGVHVVQVDLSIETAVKDIVLENEIDIVVHTASSFDSNMANNLLKALGQRRSVSGEATYLIQASVTTMFAAGGGWPYGEVRDTDQIFSKEKEIERGNPVRETNILVVEQARALGVTSVIVPIPVVYGRGSGEARKLSVFMPALIRASVKHKKVYKFDIDASQPAAHISDVVALYALLVGNILHQKPIPSGEDGYCFAMGHKIHWWSAMQSLAEAVYARGLVVEPKTQIWPSDQMAAENLGFPVQYVRIMGTSSGDLVPVNAYRLGWQPEWDEERFMASIDDEIQAVQELDDVKVTVFDTLK